MEAKICSKCGIEKPLTDFNKDKNCKDGHKERCRNCVNEYQRSYYKKHRSEKPQKYIEWTRNSGRKRTERMHNNEDLRKKHSNGSMNWYNKSKEILVQKRHETYVKNKDLKNLKRRTRYKTNEVHRLKVIGYVDSRKRKFGYNLAFQNEIDEPIERHHFNHNNLDYVCEPTELHELYPGRNTNHRSNNLPILIQLYPELINKYPEIFDEFPDIATGPINDNSSLSL